MTMQSHTISASEHRIQSVTVFKSRRAEIVREFALDLKAGQNKIEIKNLPGSIDTRSVRVSGYGDASRLFDVVCTVRPSHRASTGSSEKIRQLRAKKERLESEKRVRDHEAEILVSFSKTLNAEHVNPKDVGAFLDSFVERGKKNLDSSAELAENIVRIDREIEEETRNAAVRKGTANGEITVVLSADEDGSVDLKITYIVLGADWHPTYELHATTENGEPSRKLTLHYRARISQATGEDWSDAALGLSTSSSESFEKRVPELPPVKVARSGLFHTWKQIDRYNNAGGFFNSSSLFGSTATAQQGAAPGPSVALFGGGGSRVPGAVAPQPQHQQQQQPAAGLFGSSSRLVFGATMPLQQQSTQPSSFSEFGRSVPDAPATAATAPATTSAVPVTAGAAAQAVPAAEDDPALLETEAHPLSEPSSVVLETPAAMLFGVSGRCTVPSDGVEHQVPLAVIPFEAKMQYVVVPRIDPRVYLQCQIGNNSEYKLLAGPVIVIMDDGFVSNSSIKDVNKNETFTLVLTDDSLAQVSYSRTSRTKKERAGAFAEARQVLTVTSRAIVRNKHAAFALQDLVVRDVVPTPARGDGHESVKVVLRRPEGLADMREGEVGKVDVPVWLGGAAAKDKDKDEDEEEREREHEDEDEDERAAAGEDKNGDGDTETGKDKRKKDKARRTEPAKVMWSKSVDGKGGEKEGKFEWRCGVPAGAEIELKARWEVRAPADLLLVEKYDD